MLSFVVVLALNQSRLCLPKKGASFIWHFLFNSPTTSQIRQKLNNVLENESVVIYQKSTKRTKVFFLLVQIWHLQSATFIDSFEKMCPEKCFLVDWLQAWTSE